MKKTIFTIGLCLAMFCAGSLYAQEIPADIKTKIQEKAKAKKNWSEEKRANWIERQHEAWESINSAKYSLPKSDVQTIKAKAQEKFPYHYSKQEPFISEQTDALIEAYSQKENFDKAEFDELFKQSCKNNANDFVAVSKEISEAAEIKNEIKDFKIDGMDADTLNITKNVLAQKYKLDYKKQLAELKKQDKMLDSVEDAKKLVEKQKQKENKKALTKNEIIKLAEAQFKKGTLLISGNSKTGTGIITTIDNKTAIIFPATLYSEDGIKASTATGEEADISLKRCYSAKEYPLMMTFLEELPFEVVPMAFATTEEMRQCVGKDVVVIGNFAETTRALVTKLTKITSSEVKTQTNILNSYQEGSLILTTSYKPIAICLNPTQKLPELKFSNRMKNELERNLKKKGRYLTTLRTDTSIKWVPVNIKKMQEQKKITEQLKEINYALMATISGSLSEAAKNRITQSTATKYMKVLETRMDITKIRLEYRSFISSLTNILRRPLAQVKTIDIYANMRDELGLHLAIAKKFEEALKNENRRNSNSLAPKEFKKAFDRN